MLLECDAVEKAFDDGETRVPVLRGVSFAMKAGDTLALTGESGSGKSTLLHIVAGLEPADAGSVRVLGKALGDLDDRARARMRRHDIALVFQQFNLIPSLTVAANITFHARLADRLDPDLTKAIVSAFGLEDHLDKFPEALSGGQQQRVAIARALAASPKLLLADEPTGNLDEDTADKVMAQMLALVDRTGAGLLVVSHSEKVAGAMARRLHLSGGLLT